MEEQIIFAFWLDIVPLLFQPSRNLSAAMGTPVILVWWDLLSFLCENQSVFYFPLHSPPWSLNPGCLHCLVIWSLGGSFPSFLLCLWIVFLLQLNKFVAQFHLSCTSSFHPLSRPWEGCPMDITSHLFVLKATFLLRSCALVLLLLSPQGIPRSHLWTPVWISSYLHLSLQHWHCFLCERGQIMFHIYAPSISCHTTLMCNWEILQPSSILWTLSSFFPFKLFFRRAQLN